MYWNNYCDMVNIQFQFIHSAGVFVVSITNSWYFTYMIWSSVILSYTDDLDISIRAMLSMTSLILSVLEAGSNLHVKLLLWKSMPGVGSVFGLKVPCINLWIIEVFPVSESPSTTILNCKWSDLIWKIYYKCVFIILNLFFKNLTTHF